MLTAGEQEESESGGSRIVSSRFDAELKTRAKKREKKSKVYHERGRGTGGERREEGEAQNMLALFAYVHLPLFH